MRMRALGLQVIVNPGHFLYPSVEVFDGEKEVMNIGGAIFLAKTVCEVGNDMASELVVGDMGGTAFEIGVRIGKCYDPVGKCNIVRLMLNDLVKKFVLPVLRKPLGL